MARDLEYLAEALEEAEASARWYAERSPAAALSFDAELDAAERAISEQPEVWTSFGTWDTSVSAPAISIQCGVPG